MAKEAAATHDLLVLSNDDAQIEITMDCVRSSKQPAASSQIPFLLVEDLAIHSSGEGQPTKNQRRPPNKA